jgi:hypothetical protein
MARAPRPAGRASVTRNNRLSAGVGAVVAVGAAVGTGLFVNNVLNSGSLKDPFSGDSSYFPEDLAEIDHWVEFTAKQTTGAAPGALGGLLGQNIQIGSSLLGGTIRLPMPSNLSTDYNPEYSTPELGPAAGMAIKPIERGMYGMGSMGNDAASGVNLSGLGGLAGAAASIAGGAGLGAAAQAAIGAAGNTTAGALLKVAAGLAVNQHKIVLFTGVNFRDHSFSWKLSPKNREESDAIKKIVDMFTYYSHPEFVAGGLFFKYPEFFEIKFRHPQYLFQLQPSVCTDIRVNYHGQGYAGYIRDADGGGIPAPIEVELSLTFKEVEIVTKKELNANMSGGTTYRTNPTLIAPPAQPPTQGPTRTQGDR